MASEVAESISMGPGLLGSYLDTALAFSEAAYLFQLKVSRSIVDEITRPYKYLKVITRHVPKPNWHSKNEVIGVPGIEGVILRHFSGQDTATDPVPTLFGPPMAGHGSHIVDFKDGQSLVETALMAGYRGVYVLDWQSADWSRRNEKVDDYIIKTKACIEAVRRKDYNGEKVRFNMFGFCQNGWQMAMYASMYPEDVNALVLAGAPIDPQKGNSKIKQLANMTPAVFYDLMTWLGRGNMDGRYIVGGFIGMNSIDRINDFVSLYRNIHDEEHVQRWVDFSDWYHHNIIRLPGKFYRQVVKHLFKESRLVKGTFRVLGEEVSLSQIGPLHGHRIITIGGTEDDITDPADCHCIAEHVQGNGGTGYGKDREGRYLVTPPESVPGLLEESAGKAVQLTVPAGHLGLFIKREILRDYYRPVFRHLISS